MLRTFVGTDSVVNQVLVAFGANLGNPVQTFHSALDRLIADEILRSVRCSPIFSTPPVGGPVDQPDYANAVVTGRTTCSPRELLIRLLEVERMFGRDRDREIRWGPRRLDLDLIAVGDIRCSVPGLDLPHPRAGASFCHGSVSRLFPSRGSGSIREIVRSFPSQWPKKEQGQEVFQCS